MRRAGSATYSVSPKRISYILTNIRVWQPTTIVTPRLHILKNKAPPGWNTAQLNINAQRGGTGPSRLPEVLEKLPQRRQHLAVKPETLEGFATANRPNLRRVEQHVLGVDTDGPATSWDRPIVDGGNLIFLIVPVNSWATPSWHPAFIQAIMLHPLHSSATCQTLCEKSGMIKSCLQTSIKCFSSKLDHFVSMILFWRELK